MQHLNKELPFSPSYHSYNRKVEGEWQLDSWKLKPVTQLPSYPSFSELSKVLQKLQNLPPLISVPEINELREFLAKAANGEMFLLQAGDCAESFLDATSDITLNKVEHLSQLSDLLSNEIQLPVISVGRMAGQYAKPRTAEYELYENTALPVYRGDIINDKFPAIAARISNPALMLTGYECAKKILNSILIENKSQNRIFVSHEALLLYYEQSLSRLNSNDGKYYNISTHFPWLGMRTSTEGHAHIEYLRGIANPIGIKIGPDFTPNKIQNIINVLNPENIPGRLTLIYRFGASKIKTSLPRLINTIEKTKRKVTWCCDPMHGNTEKISDFKIRRMSNILSELGTAFDIHREFRIPLGGVHLELTHSEKILECVSDDNIMPSVDSYQTLVDPRLNKQQSFDVINFIINNYRKIK